MRVKTTAQESNNPTTHGHGMKLRSKIVASVLAVSVPPFMAMAWMLVGVAQKGLEKEAVAKLEAARDNKRSAVERYFEDIGHQILSFSEDGMIVEAMRKFPEMRRQFRAENEVDDGELATMGAELANYYEQEFGQRYREKNKGADSDAKRIIANLSEDTVAHQFYFIEDNPNPLGEKENMDRNEQDRSRYGELHERLHPVVRNYLRYFGYYDIFLADLETGTIVYSVFKELDFSTSLIDGPYADTNFGEVFRTAAAKLGKDEYAIVDYRNYAPSYEDPASFIASPVFDGERKIGVAMFQMPIERLNHIMGERAGMGETGESYLVGPDSLMRSDSHRDPERRSVVASFHDPANGKVETEPAKAALAGQTGVGRFVGYHGVEVLSAYCPVRIGDFTWALVVEIERGEALAAAGKMKTVAWLLVALGMALIVAGGLGVARWIQKPVREVQQALGALAQGDLSACVEHQSADEIGEMADACRTIVAVNRDLADSVSVVAEGDWTKPVPVRSENDVMGRALNAMVGKVGSALAQVRMAVGEVNGGTSQIADAAQNLSQGATEAAASLEEISASATEIGSQAKHNAETAAQASHLAEAAKAAAETGSQRMHGLNASMAAITESSAQIAKIIKAIDDIAFQTNILALNAAVESARAGRHGKGFAVVAEEVRSLAARSAKAARETADLIEGSKGRVDEGNRMAKETAEALAEIVGGIVKVGDLVGEMAAASNEQAQGIAQISQGLGQIDQVTQQNTATAEETAAAAEELSGQADELRALIGQFKV